VERVNSRFKEFGKLDSLKVRGLAKSQFHPHLAMLVLQANGLKRLKRPFGGNPWLGYVRRDGRVSNIHLPAATLLTIRRGERYAPRFSQVRKSILTLLPLPYAISYFLSYSSGIGASLRTEHTKLTSQETFSFS